MFWPLQRRTFENIVAKGEIAHDEQFVLLPQCFQLFLYIITLSFTDIFKSRLLHICFNMGKGLILIKFDNLSDLFTLGMATINRLTG